MAQGAKLNNGQGPQTVDGLVSQLGEKPLDMPASGVNSLQALYQDIEALMNEILESNTIASLESLKTHNDYTFQHSVDVAVLGILLGRTAGLPRDQLRELALGCLLHDLGKMYIDQAILDKPDKLTPEEFDEIKEHPQMGFELIRRMPVFGSVDPSPRVTMSRSENIIGRSIEVWMICSLSVLRITRRVWSLGARAGSVERSRARRWSTSGAASIVPFTW